MKTYKFRGEWRGKSAGGCLNHSTWRYNPQLFLTVKDTTTLSIKLTQEGEDNTVHHIGFYVARSDGSGRRQLQLSRDQLIAKAAFEDCKTVTSLVTLEASPISYVVIPCTFCAGSECKFTMTFTTEGGITLEPLSPSKEWKHVMIEGAWKEKSAGGCKNNVTCSNNPQYLLQLSTATNVHLLLVQSSEAEFDHIGFYVCTTLSSSSKLVKISSVDIVGKSEFASSREAYWSSDLKASSMYVIIPCTFDPGWESKFRLTVLTDHPIKIKKLQDAKGLTVQGEWSQLTAGGCINHPSWRNNPQYSLQVTKEIPATITLKQLDDSGDADKLASIGFYVSKSKGRKQLILRPRDLVGKGPFERRKSVAADVILTPEPEPYVIIPSTFYPNHHTTFSLSVSPHINCQPSDVKLCKCKDLWQSLVVQGKWEGETAGGCRNHETWVNNPQVSISLQSDADVVILLTQPNAENSIGFYVVNNSGSGAVKYVNKTDIVEKSMFRKDEEVNCECRLPAGDYNIIPCLFTAGVEGSFLLWIYVYDETFTYATLHKSYSVMTTTIKNEDNMNSHHNKSVQNTHHTQQREQSLANEVENSLSSATSALPRELRNDLSDGSCSSSLELSNVIGSPAMPKEKKKERKTNDSLHNSHDSKKTKRKKPKKRKKSKAHSKKKKVERNSGSVSLGKEHQPLDWEIDFEEVEILEKIGQGGFGVVYKGLWRGTTVAVKKLLHDEMDESDYEEFIKEIEMMNKLRHPNCVLFLGACLKRPNICIVTEFLEKGNLAEVLVRSLYYNRFY